MIKNISRLFFISTLVFSFSCQSNNIVLPVIDSNQTLAQSKSETNKYSTFKRDLWIAQSEARRWDISAELIRAEASFVSEQGSSNWTYYFKSPFKRNSFRVMNGFGQETPMMFFGREINDFFIKTDSDKALQIAKENGLKSFPVSEMVLEKRFASAEWEIRSREGYFRVDAESFKFVSNKEAQLTETKK